MISLNLSGKEGTSTYQLFTYFAIFKKNAVYFWLRWVFIALQAFLKLWQAGATLWL